MIYRIIKYGLLIVLIILTLSYEFPTGDYVSGLGRAICIILFLGLLILSFIIFTIIDFIRFMKKKSRFDFIPVTIIIIFFIAFLNLSNSENDKFWTKTVLTAQTDDGTEAQLKLYGNNTFLVKIPHSDCSFHYQGDYKIHNDTLILERKDLPELTSKLVGTRYKVSKHDSMLIPFDNEYKKFKIKTVCNTPVRHSSLSTYCSRYVALNQCTLPLKQKVTIKKIYFSRILIPHTK